MGERDTQRTPPAAGPAPGAVVGGFVIGDRLGEGGMGVVHRALSPDGRPAAVKFLVASGAGGREAVRRFAREAGIRIPHANVCQVLDAGQAPDGTPWIAMELLEGESLEARLGRGPLAPAEVVDLGVQVCRGLTAAHAAGVVHRDLKPSNLFLCRDGTVKLFDFGIALLWSGEATRMTTAGMILGTPWYLSPEQARGQADLDVRTDVWSLGVALWESLAGRAPFARETPLASVVAVLMEDPPPLSVVAPSVPPSLGAVIERAMRKVREERWPDAAVFGDALLAADLTTAPAVVLAGPVASRSIPPGEQRVVAVLLAQGVRDRGAIEAAVREQGGLFMPLVGGRALGLFGGDAWEGDEVLRAATAAASSRGAAASMSVSSGRAAQSGAGIAGSVLHAAEAGCGLGVDGVAIDAEAARGLGDSFALREVAGGFVELPGARSSRDSLPRAEEEGVSATYGRQAELAVIRQAVERLLDERRAAALLVTGPPGIGKSRLRREAARLVAAAAPGAWVLAGRGEPLRRESAFALVLSAIREHALLGAVRRGWPRLDPAAPLHERRLAVLRLALEAVGEQGGAPGWVSVLGELLGIDVEDAPGNPAAPPRDPQVVRDRFRMALLDYFGALAARAPLALLVEDLQWADVASLELLEDLLDRHADRPLLVLATARPELRESGREPFAGLEAVRLQLRGLAAADVARLGAAVAGRSLSEGLVRLVAERTAGNPLFVREILLELRARGSLDADRSDLPLPLTVEAAVQSRLDHLRVVEKDLCKRAAVFGRPFATPEVSALGVAEAERTLESLSRQEIRVARGRVRGGRDWQFRSALVADVAYRMLADDLRAELHRRAAGFLSAGPQPEPEEVATHFERGGQSAPAAEWYRRAARAAAERGDSVTVVRCAEAALRDVSGGEGLFELYRDYAVALGYLGRREEQERELGLAIVAARRDADRAHILVYRAELFWRTGRMSEAFGAAEAAVACAARAADRTALALARSWQVAAFSSAGRIGEAREALREAEELASGAEPGVQAFVAARRAELAGALGDLAERRDAFAAAVRLFRAAGDVRRAAGAAANLADVHNRVGAYDDAAEALRAAVEDCRRVGNRVREGWALCNLGYSRTMAGAPRDALVTLAEAERVARAVGDPRLRAGVRLYRLRALLALPDPAAMSGEADAALAEAERLGAPGLLVLTLTVAARGRLACGDGPGALVLSERALGLRDQLGGVEEDEAEIYLTHARALAAVGRIEEARCVQQTGRDRLWAIAGRIADLGWRARFLRDVPAHRMLVESDEFG
ncbi:MAG: protein kinase [Deltaproteobacteria bacterium]|nr:protein kinase [Deltaproteobacteria bacterium]